MRWVAAVVLAGCAEGGMFPGDGGYPDSQDIDSRELTSPPDAPQPPERDAAGPPDGAPCTGGSTALEYDHHCYLRFTGAVPDWSTAASSCASQVPPAHLATIADAGEDTFVDGLAAGAETWIGLQRANGVWSWVSGEPFAFADWGSGEPNGSGACVRVKESRWADLGCGQDLGYICERE